MEKASLRLTSLLLGLLLLMPMWVLGALTVNAIAAVNDEAMPNRKLAEETDFFFGMALVFAVVIVFMFTAILAKWHRSSNKSFRSIGPAVGLFCLPSALLMMAAVVF